MAAPDRTAVARQLGIELEASQWASLTRYVELLRRWNARFNLISRQDVARIWSRHVYDSLSVLPLLQTLKGRASTTRALDVGTGAGFPGLPLAVLDPTTEWRLVDRNARKVRFLELVANELALTNVRACAVDLGGAPPAELVGWADVIVSRAMAAPSVLVERSAALLAEDGVFVLMTGAAGGREPGLAVGTNLSDGGSAFRVSAVHALRVPGLDRTHEVTIIRRDGNGRAE